MCGSFALQVNKKGILKLDADLKADFDRIENSRFFPGQNVPTLLNDKTKSIKYLKWGLIPYWAKDDSFSKKLFNARAESIQEKPSFKKPFKSQRCLIFADSYFEWKKIEGSKSSKPFLIKLLNDEVFTFAGVWDVWKSQLGENILTTTIITTEPNEIISTIHNRMPVIIDKENWDAWLYSDSISAKSYLKSYPSDLMELIEI